MGWALWLVGVFILCFAGAAMRSHVQRLTAPSRTSRAETLGQAELSKRTNC